MNRCGWLRRLERDGAGAAIDADGCLAPDGGSADYPFLLTVVIDGAMLGGGIVPYRHVARIPAPADRVFELGDVGLKEFEQMVRIRLRIADEAADVMPEDERAFAGAGQDADNRMSVS
jgi:hypothetical protein